MTNVAGRATALTLVTPLRRGWGTWERALLWLARHFRFVTAPMRKMSFIHYAQWSLVDQLPGADGPERLPAPTLFFQSNFSVTLDQYIDTFVHASPTRIRAVWLGARGRPWMFPFDRYLAWVSASSMANAHYYCAYPSVTTTEVVAATTVRDAVPALRAAARAGDGKAFEQAWQAFLTKAQHHL
jgi:hypothetical protein